MDRRPTARRGTALRNAVLDAKQAQLEKERGRKRDEAELREALVELKKVAEAMGGMKPFELGQQTLAEWAEVVLNSTEVLEDHLLNVVPPPTPHNQDEKKRSIKTPPTFTPTTPPQRTLSHVPIPPKYTYHGYLSGASYLLLEAIADYVRAERAVVYQYISRTDELQAICVVNESAKPSSIRTPAGTGWCGEVFTRGISVNVSNSLGEDTGEKVGSGYRIRSQLIVPVLDAFTRKCFGVVQVANKNRGTAAFTETDESALSHFSSLISYVTQRYPSDTLNSHFDPALLHKVKPWRAAAPQNMAVPIFAAKNLVFRSNQSGHVMKKRFKDGEESVIEVQKGIEEVDSHIKSLEDSWMKSVQLNVEYEKENNDTVTRMRELRDLVKQKKKIIKDLTAEVEEKNEEIITLRAQQQQQQDDPPATLGTFLRSHNSFLPKHPSERSLRGRTRPTVSTVKLPSM